MNCVQCGYEILPGFTFCPNCGAKQPKPCPKCSYLCLPDFAFCPQCGADMAAQPGEKTRQSRPDPPPVAAPVAEPAREPAGTVQTADADRRTVTVLFADLCNFTTLSEQTDPELLQTLQNELFEELTSAVTAFGGFVDKFIGDALLALFGAPQAHEDDPERALHSALEMIHRLTPIAERWRNRISLPLALHIGVNTGPVVAGGLGASGIKAYSVTGDTVNIAQRLQSMAEPGDILVGPVTHRFARHAFSFSSLGTLPLRGKTEGVLVHRLTGRIEAAASPRGLSALGFSAPMVGRDAELGSMLRRLDAACAGVTQLVRLTGEAGAGKTRLVNEFLDRVRNEPRFAGVVVRQAACSSFGEPSYGALAAIVRCAYEIGTNDPADDARRQLSKGLDALDLTPADRERLVPLFLYILGFGDPGGALKHVEPEQLRRQIFYAIRTILERRLERAPLLLVIEDLHWADAASLETLRFAMDRLERNRLMLLTTHRPAFETDRLNSAKAGLTMLRLSPLSTAEGHGLLSALFGADGLPARLRDRILERAGGNPLFIEEIVRSLIESGRLQRNGARWDVTAEAVTADIPLNIQAIMLARIDRLPPRMRKLAQTAAVIGTRFDTSVLEAVFPGSAGIETDLDQLCEAEIIEEVAGTTPASPVSYGFRQTMLHELVYDNLLLKRRIELHGLIGETLERRYGADPDRLEDLALLGHHFGRSAQKPKGAGYLMAAGDRARMAYANDDAIRFYREALDALDDRRDGAWLVPCERIADLCGPTGQRDRAMEFYGTVLKAYQDANDKTAAARILRKLGRLLFDSGNREAARSRFAEAAALLEDASAPIEQAHLLQEQGHLAFRTGDYAGAIKWADKALHCAAQPALQEDGGETANEATLAIAQALNTKGTALARLGNTREAVAEVERSVEAALRCGQLNAACRGYTNLGVLYTIIDPALAIKICARGYEMARRIGDFGYQARLLTNIAVAYCTFTDRCAREGMPAVHKALAIDRALDQRDHLPVPLLVLAQIYQCHGQPDLARRHYLEALDAARDTGEAQLLFPCYDGLATLSLDDNDMDEAERYFDLAQDICARHDIDPKTLIILPFLD
ncbi:AAA family ATPase [Pararhizobium sp. YC-54]|uniref:adenylate/guanylate cyclase domain-containing protein n=1 Tax=Pararhizobium sp. YC-54 TaxID=2986920 RepID=UPI0021F6CDBF|nr:adenylate/guanylate cyclase domain-containing protein [Pararhizobium sp. YC-54]MCW0001604.1 AAA family ATPase [Pararhizobium sp. YC-54]